MLYDLKSGKQIYETHTLLKGEDVARLLNISRSFAYQLIQRREIPIVKLGRSVRVRPEDLEQFIKDSISS
jgi:excisionase family DNA binding protein